MRGTDTAVTQRGTRCQALSSVLGVARNYVQHTAERAMHGYHPRHASRCCLRRKNMRSGVPENSNALRI